jgi:DNA-binding GntR family transcriptional regulator
VAPTKTRTAAPQPRYHEAYQRLVERINDGDFATGDRLPSERWLSDELGVSRSTVRRALEELASDGLIAGGGRSATIATAPTQNRLVSLTEVATARGLVVSARVLIATVRAATLDEAEEFSVAAGADMFELRRLRFLDSLPVALDHDVVPLKNLPNPTKLDFTSASFYGSLENAGHRLVRSRVQIEAAAVTKADAKLLGLSPGAPVLVTTDHSSDASGALITIGRTIFRSDRHRFLATFTRTTRD